MLTKVAEGDVVVVTKTNRFTRSTIDLLTRWRDTAVCCSAARHRTGHDQTDSSCTRLMLGMIEIEAKTLYEVAQVIEATRQIANERMKEHQTISNKGKTAR
jgi:DNA invertase Pin-like site-specific DNA recombinase